MVERCVSCSRVQVDDDGKELLIAEGRAVGCTAGCSTCTNDDASAPSRGFRAEVRGIITDLGDGTLANPPRLMVTEVRGSNMLGADQICAAATDTPEGDTPMECFSGSNNVQVQGKGTIPISELSIGDYVLGSNGFSRVYSFGHLDFFAVGLFVRIWIDGGGSGPLEISARHMLRVNSTMMMAAEVGIGDWIDGRRVVDVKTARSKGLYAPITESGDLVVSGVVASSYVVLLPAISTPIQASITHMMLSVHRMACQFNWDICEKETYSVQGYSRSLALVVEMAQIISRWSIVLQLMIVVLSVAPVAGTAYVLEQIWAFPVIAALAAGFAVHCLSRRRTLKPI